MVNIFLFKYLQAKLINVNYGDADDYKYITAQSINLEGKIALIRGPRKYAYAKVDNI